jgi:hypothetical protein
LWGVRSTSSPGWSANSIGDPKRGGQDLARTTAVRTVVSGSPGRAGVDGHAGVLGDLTRPGRCPSADRRPATSVDRVMLAAATADMAPGAARSDAVRTAATAGHSPSSKRSIIGVRPPWPPQLPVQHRSSPTAETAEHFHCGHPTCRPGSGHPRTLCRVRCHPAAAVARGTGRRVGGRWWGAASAGGRERAGRSGGRAAGRGHRSSPAG